MSNLENSMSDAGVDVEQSRLRVAASDAIDRAKGNLPRALIRFRITLLSDPRLLATLIGVGVIDAAAQLFLKDERRRVSSGQNEAESHVRREPEPPGTLPDKQGRASQRSVDSQPSADRPSLPSTKISRGAAVAATRGGIWSERVAESFNIQIGDISQYDYRNLCIQNAFSTAWKDGLSDIDWPDMLTPLKDFADKSLVENIRNNAIAARDAALANAKRISHAS